MGQAKRRKQNPNYGNPPIYELCIFDATNDELIITIPYTVDWRCHPADRDRILWARAVHSATQIVGYFLNPDTDQYVDELFGFDLSELIDEIPRPFYAQLKHDGQWVTALNSDELVLLASDRVEKLGDNYGQLNIHEEFARLSKV